MDGEGEGDDDGSFVGRLDGSAEGLYDGVFEGIKRAFDLIAWKVKEKDLVMAFHLALMMVRMTELMTNPHSMLQWVLKMVILLGSKMVIQMVSL